MCKIKASIFRSYLLLQEFGFFHSLSFLRNGPNPIKKTMRKLLSVLEDCLKIRQKR